ncbi:MAG: hypothetical protein E6J45_07340 [Chloroflexi bacterium]|nr:MAG: hypothetical protein E6J45_07340 [Chloroflexota bacterium]
MPVSAHVNNENNRALVVGVARSGTSWLGMALSRARNVRYYHEPDFIGAKRDGSPTLRADGFGAYPVIRPGEDDNPFTPVWDMVFAGTFPFSVGGDGSRLRPAARAALRVPRWLRQPLTRRAAAVSMRMPRKSRYTVVKTIHSAFSLDWLAGRYNPEVVAIQRHPLNVVSSWRQLHIAMFDLAARPAIREAYLEPLGIRPPPADASELTRIAWHVGLLTHVIGDALARHPRWHLVTHEDLCVQPEAAFRGIFERLGLDWGPAVESFLDANNRPGEGLRPVRVTAEQPDRWRQRLSDAEVDEIQQVLDRFPRRGWVGEPAGAAEGGRARV